MFEAKSSVGCAICQSNHAQENAAIMETAGNISSLSNSKRNDATCETMSSYDANFIIYN